MDALTSPGFQQERRELEQSHLGTWWKKDKLKLFTDLSQARQADRAIKEKGQNKAALSRIIFFYEGNFSFN